MDPSIISSALILIAVLVAVGAVAYFGWRIKKKSQEIAQIAFGTDDLIEGFRKQEEEYRATPKSVSSVTSIVAPRILKDFPEFNIDQMRRRAENAITSYLRSIDERKLRSIPGASPTLADELRNRVEAMLSDEKYEHFENIQVHRIEISKYKKSAGLCTITFQCSMQYKHFKTNADGNVKSGSPDKWEQARWEADLVYVQDVSKLQNPQLMALGLSCPNCSAPISNLGAKHCEYCGTAVRQINVNSWLFNAVRQA